MLFLSLIFWQASFFTLVMMTMIMMLTFIHKWRNVQMYKMWPKVISCALQSLVSKCCFAKILVLLGTFNHWDDDDALDDYDEECWR